MNKAQQALLFLNRLKKIGATEIQKSKYGYKVIAAPGSQLSKIQVAVSAQQTCFERFGISLNVVVVK